MEHFVWDANPVALSFGPLHVYWYGILFALAIISGLKFMEWVYKSEQKDTNQIEPLFLYIVVGIVVGARLGHCFFYEPDYYLAHPMEIIAVWKGGLASHGGGLGAILAILLYKKKHGLDVMWLLDRLVIPTAFFGFLVRMGNFMNSEILGQPTESVFGIIFSRVDMIPRHPAQLYEGLSYLVISVILLRVYLKYKQNLQSGLLFGLFLTLVFTVRFLVEFVKERQADYTLGIDLTTGQLLSIPFLLLGIYFIYKGVKR